jgi:hypothetical protein
LTAHTSCLAGIAVTVALAATAHAAVPATSIVFDAQATSLRAGGPDAQHVGHLQLASGLLRDVTGRNVGNFAYSCRWIAILPGGDAKEHCSGNGRTSDGRLDFAGDTTAGSEPHSFHVVGGTGAYRNVRGTVRARDLGPSESLITVALTGAGASLQVDVVPRPAASLPFRNHAGTLCSRAAAALDRLPRFPFTNFDPTHPDRKLLPQVGRFFTGRGDPRPTLRRLDIQLRALRQPPAERAAWQRYLAGRRAENAARQEQDNAALAADANAFVKSLHDIDAAARRIAIAAAVFGVPGCTL